MDECYEPVQDAMVQRYLDYRSELGHSNTMPAKGKWLRRLKSHLPLAPNVSDPEFLPTMQMLFLETLVSKFPNHRLILSDFDSLPTPIQACLILV
jgi:hypothetical protein